MFIVTLCFVQCRSSSVARTMKCALSWCWPRNLGWRSSASGKDCTRLFRVLGSISWSCFFFFFWWFCSGAGPYHHHTSLFMALLLNSPYEPLWTESNIIIRFRPLDLFPGILPSSTSLIKLLRLMLCVPPTSSFCSWWFRSVFAALQLSLTLFHRWFCLTIWFS